jgi:uncharacterized protein (TIGR00269 family)
MMTSVCTRCPAPAVYLDRTSGERLCEEHLSARVEQSVRGTIAAAGSFRRGERVAVALSGGKDSSVLLHLLATVVAPEAGIDLVAITIDEGIAGYRDETLRAAEGLADRLGVPHRVVSFDRTFGRTLDTILSGREERACTVCGVLRRSLLDRAAREIGAVRLATGHCLDDEAESVLMNWLRGDLSRVAGGGPTGGEGVFVPRIKPLARLMEKEVVSYAHIRGLTGDLPECPYTRHALRAEVRGLVHRAEYRFPGTMRRITEGQAELEHRLAGRTSPAGCTVCERCGGPKLGDACRVCAILDGEMDNH